MTIIISTAQKPQRSLSTPQTCYDLLQGHDGADPLPLEKLAGS